MNLPLTEVNFMAVLGATVACMALGFFWYSPGVFGDKWMKLVGMPKKKPKKGEMQCGMAKGFLATLIGNYFLAVLLVLLGTRTIGDGATVAVVLWLATMLPNEIHGIAWEKRPLQLVYITGGNSLLTYLLGATVLMWWPF